MPGAPPGGSGRQGEHSLVRLPQGAEPPYRVFVSGVPQTEGKDYVLEGRALVFSRPLVTEGKLGFWRWTLMFFAIAGSYRRHDSVDLQYRLGGHDQVAVGLEIDGSPATAGATRRGRRGR